MVSELLRAAARMTSADLGAGLPTGEEVFSVSMRARYMEV